MLPKSERSAVGTGAERKNVHHGVLLAYIFLLHLTIAAGRNIVRFKHLLQQRYVGRCCTVE
jgi:hypothetical protein